MSRRTTSILAVLMLSTWLAPAAAQVDKAGLTFLGWSDQHVTRDGDASHLYAPIDAMNRFVGAAFPAHIGDQVAQPEFVVGCGDCTDWPTQAATNAFADAIDHRLKLPSYNIVGNHDERDLGPLPLWENLKIMLLPTGIGLTAATLAYGLTGMTRILRPSGGFGLRKRRVAGAIIAIAVGLAVGVLISGWVVQRTTIENWIVARHGGLSYSFDRGGVHFAMVFSEYSASPRLTDQAMNFIRNDLANVPKGRPVVVATHLCYEAIGNKDDLIDSFGNARVVLILSGHHHFASATEYRGYQFVRLPSPRETTEFTVIRITPDRVLALPYDYASGSWSADSHEQLDAPIADRATTRPGP